MKKVYRIHHTLWMQDTISYNQFVQAWHLTRQSGGILAGLASKEGFAKWIDDMIANETLPKIAAIILRPYEPTIVHRLWNRFWARRKKIDLNNMGDIITASPILGNIVKDFFLLNLVWVNAWFNLPLKTKLKYEEMSPGMILSALTNLFTSLAVATSPNTILSEISPPQPSSNGDSLPPNAPSEKKTTSKGKLPSVKSNDG